MTVNDLRKSSKDEEVISLSKTLIKNWKKFLANSPSSKSSSTKDSNKTTSKTSSNNTSNSTGSAKKSDAPKKEERKEEKKPYQSTFPAASNCTDAVRLKCRELLANAIKVDGTTDGESMLPTKL